MDQCLDGFGATRLACVSDAERAGSHRGVVILLRQQAELAGRLEGLARRQRAMVVQEDTGPLLGLLADRQRLVVEIASIGRQLEPVRSQWTTYRELLGEAEREETSGLLDQIRGCLSRVLEGDEDDARSLGVRKAMARQQLQETRSSGAAVGAYRSSTTWNGRRVDEER